MFTRVNYHAYTLQAQLRMFHLFFVSTVSMVCEAKRIYDFKKVASA